MTFFYHRLIEPSFFLPPHKLAFSPPPPYLGEHELVAKSKFPFWHMLGKTAKLSSKICKILLSRIIFFSAFCLISHARPFLSWFPQIDRCVRTWYSRGERGGGEEERRERASICPIIYRSLDRLPRSPLRPAPLLLPLSLQEREPGS